MGSLKAWLRLVRPEFPLMAFLGVLAGAGVAAKHYEVAFALAGVGPALIAAASFALNDYFDVESDRKLRRFDRPVASGEIKPLHALAATAVLFIAGLGLCFFENGTLAFYIAAAYAAVSIAYSAALKKTLFVGNAVVATTYAIPFIYGNVVASGSLYKLNSFVLVFAAIAFFAGLARELFNSVKDEKGDREIRALSLPMVIGAKPVLAFGALAVVVAVALSLKPLVRLGALYLPYAVPIAACDLLLLASAYSAVANSSYANLSAVRKRTVYALLLGLVGFASLAFA